jgi:hypothetical protein
MNGHWLWAFLLLYIEAVKPTYGVIMENFSTLTKLALTDSRTFMIAGDTLHIAAIALILIFITARIVKRKNDSFLNLFRLASMLPNPRASERFFEIKHVAALKSCPNCATQHALSVLICDACDYNFLAERPGRAQRLLPPPQPMTDKV